MNRVSNIDLRLLNVFVQVVESGGYSAAQAELNIGLATISAHMKSLEERIGAKLCQRGRAGFKLTEEGQLVFEEAILLRGALDRFSSLSHSLGADLTGNLNVGIVDAIATTRSWVLSDSIRRYNERANRVQIHLHIASRQELERAILDDHYDVAIGPFPTHYSGLETIPLFEESHSLFCGRGHPLFGCADTLGIDDLKEYDVYSRQYAVVDDCDRIGSQHRRAVVSSIEAQLALLLSGGYIGYLPVPFSEEWVQKKMLHQLNTPEIGYTSHHVLSYRRRKSQSKKVELFIEDVLATKEVHDKIRKKRTNH